MENELLNGLKCILRDKDFNERGVQFPSSQTLPTSLLAPSVQVFGFQCPSPPPPPFVNNPSWSSPFCTYISLYLVYGNVLCMIQTLIYIYSCITAKVTKKTSQWLIPFVGGALFYV